MLDVALGPEKRWAFDRCVSACLQVSIAALLLAVSSKICIPLWFSPIPITAQTLAVMVISLALSRRRAISATLLYLSGALFHLPLFALHSTGAALLFGTSGGYLFGFILQAYVIGLLLERENSKKSSFVLSVVLAASLLQLCVGTFWLASFVGIKAAFVMGFFPFLPGDALKLFMAMGFWKYYHANYRSLYG